jgi:hypothetical protein
MKPRLLNASNRHLDFALAENHPLRFSKARGRRVECLSGIVWITAYNETQDTMLSPGQAFVIPNNGLTLIEAIGHCSVRVDLPSLLGHALHRLLAVSGWDRLAYGLAGLRGWSRLPRRRS